MVWEVTAPLLQDEEKAEDEITKRRAAFLQKQLRKAEESRLRKLQQEADSELKRDEVRYKQTPPIYFDYST